MLCTNQITAGIISFVIGFGLLMLQFGASRIPEGSFWRDLLVRIDFLAGTQSFLKGMVDTRDVAYFLSVILLFLFLSVQAVGSRRWR